MTTSAPTSGQQQSSDRKVSMNLTTFLRHRGGRAGLNIRADGFVLLDEMLALKQFQGVTRERIEEIVRTSDKQRFALQLEGDQWYIRANQGHTMKHVDQLELTPITSPEQVVLIFVSCYFHSLFNNQVPMVIHGTYRSNLVSILQTGLEKRSRNHIHFAKGMFQEVISGFRHDVDTLIFIDLAKCLAAGILFFESVNGVILSEGVDGAISRDFFAKVTSADGTPIAADEYAALIRQADSLPKPQQQQQGSQRRKPKPAAAQADDATQGAALDRQPSPSQPKQQQKQRGPRVQGAGWAAKT
eukprot:TRINITY_DN3507_c0_g1_i2.p2 TRINITY_DN3507_c0_g1~~TRINITY_DN3507_c0_g1_i2.p2  ORF type:complete len:320 (-),score=67.70 TRINITY_DN3507_c0_g1_i2:1894-2793(-)